jgi:heme-degrading monooxygenase HmoA
VVYLRVWEYEVRPEAAGRFIADYGSGGAWARLFATADGFSGTELFRSTDRRDRFITVDTWRDEADWRRFLRQRQESYETLDRLTAEFTAVERPLLEGTFPVPAPDT